jgi:hypothetical protein
VVVDQRVVVQQDFHEFGSAKWESVQWAHLHSREWAFENEAEEACVCAPSEMAPKYVVLGNAGGWLCLECFIHVGNTFMHISLCFKLNTFTCHDGLALLEYNDAPVPW